jgi:hypothetical protein
LGSKYTTQSASGFNSSAPPDDGSQSASNLITWAGIKSKLADPTKNLADSINTALVSAFDYSVRQITTSDSTVAGDHMRCVEIAPTVTNSVSVSLGDATTMTNNYRVWVKNLSAVVQTITRVTSGDTIDGVAANITIAPYSAICFQTNAAANGYRIISRHDTVSAPQNIQTAAYTTVWADANKHILHPSSDNNARTFTIDSNANVPYPIGTMISFVNQINTVTIAITSDTLTLVGAGSTGSRTLAANGIATALKVSSTSWVITGTGLT